MRSSARLYEKVSGKVRGRRFRSLALIAPRAWALVVFSASLQIFSFPLAGPLPYWRTLLAWICLVPLLIALFTPDRNGARISNLAAASLGYFCGILWYACNCYWIHQTMYLYGGLPKPISAGILVLFALYLGLYHALFAFLVAKLRDLRVGSAAALMLSPLAWVAVELARARVTGFPWDLLGNSQVDNLLLTRLAPLAGVMALSFVVAAVNAVLASPFVLPGKRSRMVAAVSLLLVLAIFGMGSSLHATKPTPGDTYAVLMQENLSVGATARGRQPQSAFDELAQFSAFSLNPGAANGTLRLPAGTQPTLIAWPEAPSHFRSDDPYLQARLGELARNSGAAVIAGDIGLVFDPAAPRGYYSYDSASMFTREGTPGGRYDKIHLVPWGEYVPFKQFFAFAQKLTEGAGDMDPGHERSVFKTGGHAYGVFICYESIFGDEIRQFVANGADVLVNISDDGWYGDTGAPWQHLNMARMRAIENDRYLLRSTNTGITTVIDPTGQTLGEAPRHVRGAFAFPFAYQTGLTFYTRFGDWFAYLCALLTLLAFGFSFARRVD